MKKSYLNWKTVPKNPYGYVRPVALAVLLTASAISGFSVKAEGRELRLQFQQEVISVSGKVTDAAGIPLPGVTVAIKGTTNGVITDSEGNFSLNGVSPNAQLELSFIGMKTLVVAVGGKTTFNLVMEDDAFGLNEVIAVGYGTQKKGSLTGAISSVSSKDLESVPAATVSSALAGKIAGVSFRMPDGRPGSSANISVRNMGEPLYVIDGVQKDAGQFNNLSPNDIESITVLKDASAAIYGVRAANGVIVVTTKTGRKGSDNAINVNAYYGWQNWSRFPKTTNAYQWQLGKVEADINDGKDPSSVLSREELAKWKAGTERGYKSFDWYDYIIQANAPQNSINVSTSGGSDKIDYYVSYTNLHQSSVLGREFTFDRQNIQSNVNAQVAKRLKIGASINGRVEKRDNPGVPGGDDYWAPRFALFRNTPMDRPYANDNPKYINNIGHNDTNWALLNKKSSGYWTEDWRVMQLNFSGEYQFPVKGLTAKGMYSYYYADKLMNGHEYTYNAYTYFPDTDEYRITFANKNPWRERGTHKNIEQVYQGHLNYARTFENHNLAATFVAERIERRELDVWVHAVPKTNALPLIYYADTDTYNDSDWESARIGYVGRVNYNYADKYYVEVAGRQDASWKFASNKRWGFFPSASVGWRITEEGFAKSLLGDSDFNLKLRASYGELGDDNVGIGSFDYLTGYNYNSVTTVMDGEVVAGSRDKGVPVSNITWFTSKITDIGADFSLFNSRLNGTVDYFYRKRDGLRGSKWDILTPAEMGYNLPEENVNSDATTGAELALSYDGKLGELKYALGGNVSYARNKFLSSYKPRWGNSWEHYRNSSEDRWSGTFWGYEVIGQFKSMEQINNYPVDIDGTGNTTLLPGDLIYKDENGDGTIDYRDERPIGYARDANPILNFGFNIFMQYKGFDFRADFSGGAMYSYNRNWEMRWPYQNEGALLADFYKDRWHRADPYDINSEWIPGKYPALRYNKGGHSNYNKQSTFWLTNAHYLRLRTMELGYSLPKDLVGKAGVKNLRVYLSTYNLLSFDNLKDFGVEPEVMDPNGLQYPQNSMVNVGVNITL